MTSLSIIFMMSLCKYQSLLDHQHMKHDPTVTHDNCSMTTNDVPRSDDQSQLGDVAAPRSGPDTSLGPVWLYWVILGT